VLSRLERSLGQAASAIDLWRSGSLDPAGLRSSLARTGGYLPINSEFYREAHPQDDMVIRQVACYGQLREFLAGWPLRGEAEALSRAEQEALFRQRGIERGFVYRDVPRRYGGSEQPPDALADAIIREEYWRAGAPGDLGG